MTLSALSEQQASSLQQRALLLVADNHATFIESLVDIYQLKSVDVTTLQQHIVRLQALNLYKEVSVECFTQYSCIIMLKKNVCVDFSCVFLKAAMLGMKLQRQKELDLEEVREDLTPSHMLDKIRPVQLKIISYTGLSKLTDQTDHKYVLHFSTKTKL